MRTAAYSLQMPPLSALIVRALGPINPREVTLPAEHAPPSLVGGREGRRPCQGLFAPLPVGKVKAGLPSSRVHEAQAACGRGRTAPRDSSGSREASPDVSLESLLGGCRTSEGVELGQAGWTLAPPRWTGRERARAQLPPRAPSCRGVAGHPLWGPRVGSS